MRALCLIPLCLAAFAWADESADRAAIGKVIKAFNDPERRAAVVEPDAQLPDLRRCDGFEVSQLFFELKAVRLVSGDVALADASASRYGTLILKKSEPAVFVLKREGAAWKIDSLRMLERCPALW